MRILAIDSSSSAASCAILSDTKLEAEVYMNHKLQHSVILFPMIERVLSMVDISLDDIDGIAVSGGPGSFTGLRIGVSTAKGLVQGGNKKFVAISGLEAMAFQQGGFDGIICPIMDALRDNVYVALYKWDEGQLKQIYDYNAVHIEELMEELNNRKENVVFCGDGINIHREFINENLKAKAYFAPLALNMPRAASIAELALIKFQSGIEDDIYNYAPIYLRKSQAEREYEKKYGKSI